VKTIGASDAKTHFGQLLVKVVRGESFVITKRGKLVATISPMPANTRLGPKDLITDFRRRFAKSLKPFTIEEIMDLKRAGKPHCGRKK
jgi:prevent-host-death family protein